MCQITSAGKSYFSASSINLWWLSSLVRGGISCAFHSAFNFQGCQAIDRFSSCFVGWYFSTFTVFGILATVFNQDNRHINNTKIIQIRILINGSFKGCRLNFICKYKDIKDYFLFLLRLVISLLAILEHLVQYFCVGAFLGTSFPHLSHIIVSLYCIFICFWLGYKLFLFRLISCSTPFSIPFLSSKHSIISFLFLLFVIVH